MSTPILTTKLYIPPPRAKALTRARLAARLQGGIEGRLTLVSAPAGFGKTTLLSAWAATCGRPVAWLALDDGDGDPARFLLYLLSALRTVLPGTGEGVLRVLGLPQRPPLEVLLTALVNELAAGETPAVLVLDDYHRVEGPEVDAAVAFLLHHLPRTLHLVIATREDPGLPLARLRARGELTELRAADLRFTVEEAAGFLEEVMGLQLTAAQVAALDARTEGWITGLQLAGISLQGQADTQGFIASFTGSHRYVLDYLLEEVLLGQEPAIQAFLLRTAILDRMCGPLCDALVQAEAGAPSQAGAPEAEPGVRGVDALAYLERANLFVTPLDGERTWYRYHHLFGELLRQRLRQRVGAEGVADLHVRASAWYEAQGLELEAFGHAAAAGNVARAARLAVGRGTPLLFRGAAGPVLQWLETLPRAVLDAMPGLWVMYASALVYMSRLGEVEEKLRAAEAGLAAQAAEQARTEAGTGAQTPNRAGAGIGPADAQNDEPAADEEVRNLIGHMAAIRATLALTRHEAEEIVAQSQRALAYLPASNVPVRTATTWTLAYAHQLRGERVRAEEGYREAIAKSAALGHFIVHLMATLGLGQVQEENLAFATAVTMYKQVLALAGDPPLPAACNAHLGLARIAYARNDLGAAEGHVRQALHLARQIETTDRAVACELLAARLRLALGDVEGAAALVQAAEMEQRRRAFAQQAGAVADVQTAILLRRGDLVEAWARADEQGSGGSKALVHLSRGESAAAQALVAPLRAEAEARGWADVRLHMLVLEALALWGCGEEQQAVGVLGAALEVAEPPGIVRVFVDAGAALGPLLMAVRARGMRTQFVETLLDALATAEDTGQGSGQTSAGMPGAERVQAGAAGAMVQPASARGTAPFQEPLSAREVEILALIAAGLSNQEIGARLYLALDTVKGHNRRLFDKLGVQRRTEAVARARALGLLT